MRRSDYSWLESSVSKRCTAVVLPEAAACTIRGCCTDTVSCCCHNRTLSSYVLRENSCARS
jgi:hypothetical protein